MENNEELMRFVLNNPKLVTMRECENYPGLFVLKYRKSVFYDNLWNSYLEECRGTIVDRDFRVVSRPFTKIYNYGIESRAPVLAPDTMVDAYRKVNGFMVAVSWYNDNLLISTTGSTDSDYVRMARSMMNMERFKSMCSLWDNTTFIFECVSPDDPHIIPESPGLYLLGYRQTAWVSPISIDPRMLRYLADQFDTTCAAHEGNCSIQKLQERVRDVRHEGYVFYTADGRGAKIKSPYYLIKKFVARNPRTDKLMRPDIKNSIDEEYYGLIDHIQANITEYTAMDEQARLAWVRNFFETQA
jgi:hypothetical protein